MASLISLINDSLFTRFWLVVASLKGNSHGRCNQPLWPTLVGLLLIWFHSNICNDIKELKKKKEMWKEYFWSESNMFIVIYWRGLTTMCSLWPGGVEREGSLQKLIFSVYVIIGHSFSTHTKFSKKLTFLVPWYAHVFLKVFWKTLRLY